MVWGTQVALPRAQGVLAARVEGGDSQCGRWKWCLNKSKSEASLSLLPRPGCMVLRGERSRQSDFMDAYAGPTPSGKEIPQA